MRISVMMWFYACISFKLFALPSISIAIFNAIRRNYPNTLNWPVTQTCRALFVIQFR